MPTPPIPGHPTLRPGLPQFSPGAVVVAKASEHGLRSGSEYMVLKANLEGETMTYQVAPRFSAGPLIRVRGHDQIESAFLTDTERRHGVAAARKALKLREAMGERATAYASTMSGRFAWGSQLRGYWTLVSQLLAGA